MQPHLGRFGVERAPTSQPLQYQPSVMANLPGGTPIGANFSKVPANEGQTKHEGDRLEHFQLDFPALAAYEAIGTVNERSAARPSKLALW